MKNYARAIQKHLTWYKNERLGVRESGVYLHQGKEVHCGHILPRELKWLNLLEPFRREIRRVISDNGSVTLHKHFHHLNSSQAFALNLFSPFFEGGPSGATRLLRALGASGEIAKWRPEHVVDASEGTNVDIAWSDGSGAWTYCEVKLSEPEFGKAAGEARHLAKLKSTYLPDLAPHCAPELLEPASFFANYQILRNVWLAARDATSSVVFLLPRQNEVLWAPLLGVRSALKPALAERVRVVAMEDVVEQLRCDSALPQRLAWYAEMLAEKYLLPPSPPG